MITPKGYSFSAVSAGFKSPGRLDLGLVFSHTPASAAGVFTTNLFKAAPVLVGHQRLAEKPTARAVMVNAGNANACTGERGVEDCLRSCQWLAERLDIASEDILPMSTGVIGAFLQMERFEDAMPGLAEGLDVPGETAGPERFARAIMTTDAFPKLAHRRIDTEQGQARILGVAKGAGMICPNMATMLAVILTDAVVAPEALQGFLGSAVDQSFNAVTVDGDTSTNDTVYALANGASGVKPPLAAFEAALLDVCRDLARLLVKDAEGGTKVLRISVRGAADDAQAELAARAVGHSPLVKTAFYGRDANWGRIVAALGRSGAAFDPRHVRVGVAGVTIFENGAPVSGDPEAWLTHKLVDCEVTVDIGLGDGPGAYELLASDLTHAYVSVNADYRS